MSDTIVTVTRAVMRGRLDGVTRPEDLVEVQIRLGEDEPPIASIMALKPGKRRGVKVFEVKIGGSPNLLFEKDIGRVDTDLADSVGLRVNPYLIRPNFVTILLELVPGMPMADAEDWGVELSMMSRPALLPNPNESMMRPWIPGEKKR